MLSFIKKPHILFLAFLTSILVCQQRVQSNEIITVDESSIKTSIEIPLFKPAPLNFKSRADILAMRQQALGVVNGLLLDKYTPSPDIFGPVVDGRPWWGMDGTFIWGAGLHSIDGAAEES